MAVGVSVAEQPPGEASGEPHQIDAGRLKVVPVRHVGRWVSGGIALLIVALVIHAFAANHKIAWDAIPQYLFSAPILRGVWHTVVLALLAQSIGVLLGIVIAALRLSDNPVSRSVSWVYVWFFRGTPLLVQLIFWFNLGLVFDHVSLTIPIVNWTIASASTNTLITPFAAALLGLALN